MNARDAVIQEIRDAPESMVQEVYELVRALKRMADAPAPDRARVVPDFRARKKELFGDRTLLDSQGILDELRADRF